MLKRILALLKFEVREAKNGLEAIYQCSAWQPDLIFMDLMMPEMNGLAAAKKIRQGVQGNQVIIIAYTAGPEADETQMCTIPPGCNDILYKPFKINDVISLLNHYLNIEISV